jgi:Phosphoglucomutase/phosphomannomutase, alpha/beta/alpha domain III
VPTKLLSPDHCIHAGFKYIGNTALDLVRDGFEAPFGYEEAIGFMFGSNIRDKDGVAATVCLGVHSCCNWLRYDCGRFTLLSLLLPSTAKAKLPGPICKSCIRGKIYLPMITSHFS